jgi:hypothetical protein
MKHRPVSDHVVAIESLPTLHEDPFDRVLVAQATVEGVTLLTIDCLVAQYAGPIRTVCANSTGESNPAIDLRAKQNAPNPI